MTALDTARDLLSDSPPDLTRIARLVAEADDPAVTEYAHHHLSDDAWAWVPGVRCWRCASVDVRRIYDADGLDRLRRECDECRGTGWTVPPLYVKRTPVTAGEWLRTMKIDREYRLPTAAEWRHFAGEVPIWTARNAERQVHPVATREPTRWGLYDVWGVPSEWLSDGRIAGVVVGWPQPIAEPVGPPSVGFRPVRTALNP